MSLPSPQSILAIVSERIAAGQGERDEANTLDTYEGVVVADGCACKVTCVWPDGVEAHEDGIGLTCEPTENPAIEDPYDPFEPEDSE